MIKFETDKADIKEFHVAGTHDILAAELSMLVGIVHGKFKSVDQEEAEVFRLRMQRMMEDGSSVWNAPDLPCETTVMKIPRK